MASLSLSLVVCEMGSQASLPHSPAGPPQISSPCILLRVAVGVSSSSEAPHPRQQAACRPTEDAVTARAYGGHMPRGNTAAHGTRHRSSGGDGAEPDVGAGDVRRLPAPWSSLESEPAPLGDLGCAGGTSWGDGAVCPRPTRCRCPLQDSAEPQPNRPWKWGGVSPTGWGGEGAAGATSPWYSERPSTWPAFPRPGSGRASMVPSHGVVSEARGAGEVLGAH